MKKKKKKEKRKKERKKKKKKKQTYQVWLSNGSGSTSRCRDIGSNMMELPVTVALVPHLSPLSGGSSSFHRFHVNNIELLLFNVMCISHDFIILVFLTLS